MNNSMVPSIPSCAIFLSGLTQIYPEINESLTIFTDNESVFFDCFVREFPSPVVIVNWRRRFSKYYYQYIFKAKIIAVFVSEKHFPNMSQTLRENAAWNLRARVLVVTDRESNALNFLRLLWRATWAVNATVMVVGETGAKFFTWIPYLEKSCGTVEELVELQPGRIFPYKFYRNLNACPLRVVSTPVVPYVSDEWHGIEPEILLAAAKVLNLTYTPVALPPGINAWQHTDEFGQPMGGMKMLFEHDAEFVICHFLRTWLGFQSADMTIAHSEAGLFWFMPAPAPVSRVNSIFKAFSLETWMAFGVALLGILLIGFLDHSIIGGFDGLALVLNQPIVKPMTRLFRIFGILVYFYSMHTSTAYQSSLIVFLSAIAREKSIETFSQLVFSDMKFLYLLGADPLYNQSQHDLWRVILSPERVVNVTYINMEHLTGTRDYFTVGSKDIMEYAAQDDQHYDQYGYPRFISLPEPFSSDYVVLYVSPGHPLLSEIDRVILWLFEAGLPNFWAFQFTRKKRPRMKIARQPFGFANLEGAFWVLGAALTVSGIVLFVELAVFFIVSWKNRRQYQWVL